VHRRDLGIVFAGGGNRAFYQHGLMRRWGPRLLPRTAAFVTCSAGACVAAMWLADRETEARERWLARTRGLQRNLDWRRCLRGERLAPHGDVLREILLTIGADGGLERLRATPFPVLVLASAFPDVLPPTLAVCIGIGAYQFDRALRPHRLHPTLGRRLAFSPALYDMRECATCEDLADLVLASSATPPFTPVGRYRGRWLLDGGMVDNAPAFVAESLPEVRRTLVLLTRPYPAVPLGRRGARCYVAPTIPPPLERWDYTRPHLMAENVALGERDADHHWELVEAFLNADPLEPGDPGAGTRAGLTGDLAGREGESPTPRRSALTSVDLPDWPAAAVTGTDGSRRREAGGRPEVIPWTD
jgi:predicted acylesterase/phospholipase RssA